jgi:hypothetical protein
VAVEVEVNPLHHHQVARVVVLLAVAVETLIQDKLARLTLVVEAVAVVRQVELQGMAALAVAVSLFSKYQTPA